MRNFRTAGPDGVSRILQYAGWFASPGSYFLADGQYGSTGKGLLAAVLAKAGLGKIDIFTCNAGPNSGHTAVLDNVKIMTQQLPVGAAVHAHYGKITPVFMNAGSILVPDMLRDEMQRYDVNVVHVHPCAAIVTAANVEQEKTNGAALAAGTGKGTGAALAAKVNRDGVLAKHLGSACPGRINDMRLYNKPLAVIMVELSQGFSLGVNEPRFAPHTTSRECTVQQAMSDARIPLSSKRNVALSLRVHPIRVGNTEVGYSGDMYPDQTETSWEALGQTPELTTVTKRVRRVFTWSWTQFEEAVRVNEPDTLFINFLNYLPEDERTAFLDAVVSRYEGILVRRPTLLGGFGPDIKDVVAYTW